MAKAMKADVKARAIELGITATLSGNTGAYVALVIATEQLAAAFEALVAQNVEDLPRIDRSLDLTAAALKAA